jgi:hypothetical protein
LIPVSLLIYYCFPFLLQHEAQLVDDGTTFSGFQQFSIRYGSSDDDYANSDDTTIRTLRIKREQELKRRPQNNGWVFKRVFYLPITASFFLSATRVEQTGSSCYLLALQKQHDSFKTDDLELLSSL